MAAAVSTSNLTLSAILSNMSSLSLDSDEADIYDSEAYDTDLEDPKEAVEPRPYIGIEAYKESCDRLHVAPQNIVLQSLPEQEMKLRYRNLGPDGIRPVITSLLKNTRVVTLDLCDTGLGDIGAGFVAQMLLDNDFICNLDLSENFIGLTGTYALSEALKFNSTLIRLKLTGNKITDEAGEYFAHALKMNDRLEELDLSHNGLSASGVALGAAFVKNCCLEDLNISWNSLKRTGGVGFMKGLEKNVSLTKLNISHNGLKYDGALAVSNMLKRNKVLRYLDVSGNNITWQGALLIASGLKANTTLQVLKIGDNPITTTGSMDIIEALSGRNSRVNTLSLKNIPVIGEFEMMATAIRNLRPFDYEHGGLVTSHDMLGQRYDRKVDPMQKIIIYMKERGLRPAELFRTFDKSVANYISYEEFQMRLKKSGLDMSGYEMEELYNNLIKQGSADNEGFNYKVMVRSVRDKMEQDRMESIKERERYKKIKDYHKKILKQATIPEDDVAEYQDFMSTKSESEGLARAESIKSLRLLTRRGSMQSVASMPLPGRKTPKSALSAVSPRETAGKPLVRVLSMAGNLGGKPKDFGKTDIKKKRKKKRASFRK